MEIAYNIVLFIFVIVCFLLVGVILLQTSQSGGLGSVGGGNSYLEGALGSQGADTLLLKVTTIFAVIFMSLAITLYLLTAPAKESKPGDGKNNTSSNYQTQATNFLS